MRSTATVERHEQINRRRNFQLRITTARKVSREQNSCSTAFGSISVMLSASEVLLMFEILYVRTPLNDAPLSMDTEKTLGNHNSVADSYFLDLELNCIICLYQVNNRQLYPEDCSFCVLISLHSKLDVGHTPSIQRDNKLQLHAYILSVYSSCSAVNRRPERAERPTTNRLLPTYTKLIMSDSSVLICAANFIRKLHRLEETSPW